MQRFFAHFATRMAQILGSPWAFIGAVALVALWAVSGPLFGYSDSWELIINTATTIITFLMVFLIQNTQNRDAKAIHLKLDELIYAIKKADNALLDIESLCEEDLESLEQKYKKISETLQAKREKRGKRRVAP